MYIHSCVAEQNSYNQLHHRILPSRDATVLITYCVNDHQHLVAARVQQQQLVPSGLRQQHYWLNHLLSTTVYTHHHSKMCTDKVHHYYHHITPC